MLRRYCSFVLLSVSDRPLLPPWIPVCPALVAAANGLWWPGVTRIAALMRWLRSPFALQGTQMTHVLLTLENRTNTVSHTCLDMWLGNIIVPVSTGAAAPGEPVALGCVLWLSRGCPLRWGAALRLSKRF